MTVHQAQSSCAEEKGVVEKHWGYHQQGVVKPCVVKIEAPPVDIIRDSACTSLQTASWTCQLRSRTTDFNTASSKSFLCDESISDDSHSDDECGGALVIDEAPPLLATCFSPPAEDSCSMVVLNEEKLEDKMSAPNVQEISDRCGDTLLTATSTETSSSLLGKRRCDPDLLDCKRSKLGEEEEEEEEIRCEEDGCKDRSRSTSSSVDSNDVPSSPSSQHNAPKKRFLVDYLQEKSSPDQGETKVESPSLERGDESIENCDETTDTFVEEVSKETISDQDMCHVSLNVKVEVEFNNKQRSSPQVSDMEVSTSQGEKDTQDDESKSKVSSSDPNLVQPDESVAYTADDNPIRKMAAMALNFPFGGGSAGQQSQDMPTMRQLLSINPQRRSTPQMQQVSPQFNHAHHTPHVGTSPSMMVQCAMGIVSGGEMGAGHYHQPDLRDATYHHHHKGLSPLHTSTAMPRSPHRYEMQNDLRMMGALGHQQCFPHQQEVLLEQQQLPKHSHHHHGHHGNGHAPRLHPGSGRSLLPTDQHHPQVARAAMHPAQITPPPLPSHHHTHPHPRGLSHSYRDTTNGSSTIKYYPTVPSTQAPASPQLPRLPTQREDTKPLDLSARPILVEPPPSRHASVKSQLKPVSQGSGEEQPLDLSAKPVEHALHHHHHHQTARHGQGSRSSRAMPQLIHKDALRNEEALRHQHHAAPQGYDRHDSQEGYFTFQQPNKDTSSLNSVHLKNLESSMQKHFDSLQKQWPGSGQLGMQARIVCPSPQQVISSMCQVSPTAGNTPSRMGAVEANHQVHMSDMKYTKMMPEYHQQPHRPDRLEKVPQQIKRVSPQNGYVSVANNLLGNHPPEDILFLKCNLCAATSGSLQSFRKHFNQTHHCEPRPDQVTIQSITATRTAMQEQGLLPTPVEHTRHCCTNETKHKSSRLEERPAQKSSQDTSMDQSKHVLKDGSNTMKCMQCGQHFPTRDWGVFRRHVRAHEFPSDSKFRCNICKQAYKDSQELKDHILSFHRVQPCVCIICDVGFTHMGALSKHMRLSHQSQPPPTMDYKCLYCSKRFEHHQQLFAHMQDHERAIEAQNRKHSQDSSTPPIRKASPDSTGLDERRLSGNEDDQSSAQNDTSDSCNSQSEPGVSIEVVKATIETQADLAARTVDLVSSVESGESQDIKRDVNTGQNDKQHGSSVEPELSEAAGDSGIQDACKTDSGVALQRQEKVGGGHEA